jgi:hypothetical protein
VDLLIHPHDVSRARLLLEKLGYEELRKDKGRLHSEKDIQFERSADDVLLELHWALNPPAKRFRLESNGIWSRLQTLSFHTELIPTLSLEDTFLTLCIHGFVHGWVKLKWAYDIALLIKHEGDILDWSALLSRSSRAGCRRTMLAGVRLASLLFNVEPPDHVAVQVLADPLITAVAQEVRESIIQCRPLSRSDLAFCSIRLHDHIWDRVLVAYRYLPDAHPITTGLSRYFVRPIRLVQWYGPKRLYIAIASL